LIFTKFQISRFFLHVEEICPKPRKNFAPVPHPPELYIRIFFQIHVPNTWNFVFSSNPCTRVYKFCFSSNPCTRVQEILIFLQIHVPQSGLELARVPRVPGIRRNSKRHLGHPRILRFLILTGTRRFHSI
jgi:hypothetical protein